MHNLFQTFLNRLNIIQILNIWWDIGSDSFARITTIQATEIGVGITVSCRLFLPPIWNHVSEKATGVYGCDKLNQQQDCRYPLLISCYDAYRLSEDAGWYPVGRFATSSKGIIRNWLWFVSFVVEISTREVCNECKSICWITCWFDIFRVRKNKETSTRIH